MKETSPSTSKSNKGREIVAKTLLAAALGVGLAIPGTASAESPIKLTEAMPPPSLDEKDARLLILGVVTLLGWTTFFGNDRRRGDD